jgi:hypothetical protein
VDCATDHSLIRQHVGDTNGHCENAEVLVAQVSAVPGSTVISKEVVTAFGVPVKSPFQIRIDRLLEARLFSLPWS